jgi:hypothetical protein
VTAESTEPWTCEHCGHTPPAHRRAQHAAGQDPSDLGCPNQDVRSASEQREPRGRTLAERLFGAGAGVP